MDKKTKYIKKERRIAPHISVQSGLAFFVAVMGVLFYIDAAPGAHTRVAVVTIAVGVVWFLAHHAYVQWHDNHQQNNPH